MFTSDVRDRLRALLPGLTVESPGSDIAGRHVIVHPPSSLHRTLTVDGSAQDAEESWACVCVNNNSHGAHWLARRVEDALNGWYVDGGTTRLVNTSEPQPAPDDPRERRWTATVFFKHWRNHG